MHFNVNTGRPAKLLFDTHQISLVESIQYRKCNAIV